MLARGRRGSASLQDAPPSNTSVGEVVSPHVSWESKLGATSAQGTDKYALRHELWACRRPSNASLRRAVVVVRLRLDYDYSESARLRLDYDYASVETT